MLRARRSAADLWASPDLLGTRQPTRPYLISQYFKSLTRSVH